ncbi:MAG: hypothetical protein NVSMB4_03320 [Acidimicrobiales bacterium]
MLSEVTIRVEAGEAITVVFLAGDLDWTGAARLTQCVKRLSFSRRTLGVIIDMSGVVFTDSAGLDAIMDCQKRCEAGGVAFSLRNPSPLLGRMLIATGDASRLTITGIPATFPLPDLIDDGRVGPDTAANKRDSVADLRDQLADERDKLAGR